MPVLPIPLFTRSYKNADGSVLSDDAAVQYNGYIDQLQGLNIRPGETLAINNAKRCDGLFFWPDKNLIVCVEENSVILRTVFNNTLIDASASAAATFTTAQLATFANDGTRVFIAAGKKIHYIDEIGTLTELADAQAPTTVSHVAFLDGYILAINGDGKFYWSDIPTTTDWSALSFATAEANPDKIQAMHVVQRQIFLMGTVSTEIWENDGSTPFSRIPGGLIELGCIAKFSVIKRGNSLLWLTHTRQIVEFTGTDVKFISTRYDAELAEFAITSDCIGGLITKNGQEFCVFHFPSEQRTLVYNPSLEDWSEWGSWHEGSMVWLPYDYRSSVYDLVSGKTFVGKENALVIAYLNNDSREELLSSSTTRRFKFLRQTGFIDNGTSRKKRIEDLSFRAKRGSSATATDPILMLRYRDNGSNDWSNIRELDLGNLGETDHHITIKRMGIFRSRQFEISATDDISVVLSNAEADITVLR